MDTDEVLLGKINRATAALIVEEMAVQKAQAELVSKSKEVGLLLLEAKKRHTNVADFEAFLKRVNGLKLSRAYDLLRLAGGRTTDEELRQDARERQWKSRAKKKLPRPEPKPISVTDPPVTESSKQIPAPHRITESPEVSIEQRRADNARLDEAAKGSAHYLAEFRTACRDLLPKITDYQDQMAALTFVQDTLKRLREGAVGTSLRVARKETDDGNNGTITNRTTAVDCPRSPRG